MQNGHQSTDTINIYSIFRSINGEVCRPGQGSWATFIRFAGCNLGCNLGCNYCDTTYAQSFESGTEMTIDEIVNRSDQLKCNNVTITGGEPLAQRNGLFRLLSGLRFKNISIETNGSFPIIDHFPTDRISWVVDYKLPSSGANQYMSNIKPWVQLTKNDYIKFVIDTSNRIDYDIALSKVNQFWSEGVKAQMVFSPIISIPLDRDCFGDVKDAPNTLYKWMQENQLFQVLLNVQLHKLISLQEPD